MPFAKPRSTVASLPFFIFVAILALAMRPGEPPSSQLGAAFGLAGGLMAAVLVGRKFQSELDTTYLRGVWAGITSLWMIWIGLTLMMAIITAGLTSPVAISISVVTIGAIFAFGAWHVLKEGVDREVFLLSTSLAFFITMLLAISAALYEALGNSQPLSMWVVWTGGMLTWAVATLVISARYR